MATVNLGRIKPVFRGAYSGSTAYVIDDIVTHGNESFICIQAHGAGTQATSVTAYWTKLAAKGADGTDVGTTLTTQGDILYRDGSGLQRLAKGTATQILQMNSGANAPEWTAKPEGGLVHILTQTITSGTPASVDFIHGTNGVVFDSTYKHYVLMISDYVGDADDDCMGVRFRQGGSFRTSGYHFASTCYEQNHGQSNSAGTGNSYGRLQPRNLGNQSNENFSTTINIPNPAGSRQKAVYAIGGGRGGNGTVGIQMGSAIQTTDNAAMDGVQIVHGSGNIRSGIFSLYGMKSS